MPDIDPLDLLRAADPIREGTVPRPKRSSDALFAQVTTNTLTLDTERTDDHGASHDTDTPMAPFRSSRSRRRWRPSITLPAVAAATGLIVGGVVILNPGSTPSAAALVTDAAAASAGFDSGRVMVVIDVAESPADDMTGRYAIDYRFEGDDFSLHFDGSALDGDIEPDDPGTTTVNAFDVRGIGDDLYTSYEPFDTDDDTDDDTGDDTGDDTASFFVGPRTADTESIDALFGLRPTSMEPTTLVALLERTDDFEAVTSDDGVTTYRGSVTLASLKEIEPDSLPAGLSLLAAPDVESDDLPDELGVDVVVSDGVLETVTINIDGDTPLGSSQGTITTTFAEFGRPQNIAPPPADQVTDDPFDAMPEGFEEVLDTLEEVERRRPNLCAEVFGDPATNASGEEALAQIEAFAVCLEDAGEQAAADAFRSLNILGE